MKQRSNQHHRTIPLHRLVPLQRNKRPSLPDSLAPHRQSSHSTKLVPRCHRFRSTITSNRQLYLLHATVTHRRIHSFHLSPLLRSIRQHERHSQRGWVLLRRRWPIPLHHSNNHRVDRSSDSNPHQCSIHRCRDTLVVCRLRRRVITCHPKQCRQRVLLTCPSQPALRVYIQPSPQTM